MRPADIAGFLLYGLAAGLGRLPMRVLGWFGAERCMFGSDWPVWPDYGGALALVPDDDEVLAGTAVRTYGLEVT